MTQHRLNPPMHQAVLMSLADGEWKTLRELHNARCDRQGISSNSGTAATTTAVEHLVKEGHVESTRAKPCPPPTRYRLSSTVKASVSP